MGYQAVMRVSSLLCALLVSASFAATRDLSFRIDEGQNINSFIQNGPVAAHLLLR